MVNFSSASSTVWVIRFERYEHCLRWDERIDPHEEREREKEMYLINDWRWRGCTASFWLGVGATNRFLVAKNKKMWYAAEVIIWLRQD